MYLNHLRQDEIFVRSEIKPLREFTGIESRRGLENAIVSNGKIVNVVSNRYGHIPNELFFGKAEKMMSDSGLEYLKRSINRADRSFTVDYIIQDKNQFSLKNKKDLILPLLRFTNSYDGSEKTSGHFGFYRETCSNGLHVSYSEIEFSIRHTKKSAVMIMPRLNSLFEKFLDNEYYEVIGKFDAMIDVKIPDTEKFVQEILERTKLFKYTSGKNRKLTNNAYKVLEIIDSEPYPEYSSQNLWLGYNAFNWVLHNKLKKSFSQQERLDRLLFKEVYAMV